MTSRFGPLITPRPWLPGASPMATVRMPGDERSDQRKQAPSRSVARSTSHVGPRAPSPTGAPHGSKRPAPPFAIEAQMPCHAPLSSSARRSAIDQVASVAGVVGDGDEPSRAGKRFVEVVRAGVARCARDCAPSLWTGTAISNGSWSCLGPAGPMLRHPELWTWRHHRARTWGVHLSPGWALTHSVERGAGHAIQRILVAVLPAFPQGPRVRVSNIREGVNDAAIQIPRRCTRGK